jgi:hypothetical protein
LVPDELDLLENKRNLNGRRRTARDGLGKKDTHSSYLQDVTQCPFSDFFYEIQAVSL